MVAREYHITLVGIKLFHHLKVDGVNRTKLKLKRYMTFHEKMWGQMYFAFIQFSRNGKVILYNGSEDIFIFLDTRDRE